MKNYLILKDFKGSQDGLGDGQCFTTGTTAKLSDSLVKALGAGYVREASIAAKEIASAPLALAEAVMQAIEPAEGEESEEPPADANDRDTKVIVPDETKPKKKGKK